MEKSAMKGMELMESKGSESSGAAIQHIRLFVTGYDTSLTRDDIKSALIKHYSSCGEITYVIVPEDSETGGLNRISLVLMRGEGALEKAQKLNGGCECDVEGCKIVVDKFMPQHTSCIAQCGYVVPDFYIQRAKMIKMAKEAKEAKEGQDD